MKKTQVSWNDVKNHVQEILRQLHQDQWRPDYVVGITRGGLIPANMISQYLGCPMETLKVQLRDGGNAESNLWMAEEAFGYVPDDNSSVRSSDAYRKNILIVDDINDSGATLNWIQQDWKSGCLPNDPAWDTVWGHNVRVAVLYDNEVSNNCMDVTYSAVDINKSVDDTWIVFPWEDWWSR
jgi:xanthine phosphoribosyltransferase